MVEKTGKDWLKSKSKDYLLRVADEYLTISGRKKNIDKITIKNVAENVNVDAVAKSILFIAIK